MTRTTSLAPSASSMPGRNHAGRKGKEKEKKGRKEKKGKTKRKIKAIREGYCQVSNGTKLIFYLCGGGGRERGKGEEVNHMLPFSPLLEKIFFRRRENLLINHRHFESQKGGKKEKKKRHSGPCTRLSIRG